MEKDRKKAKRRYTTFLKATRQLKNSKRKDLSLGYFKKQKANDCGIARCFACGNPRRLHLCNKDKLTYQEKKNMHFIFE